MIKNYSDIKLLSNKYNINIEDILMIALNALGASSNYSFPRMRFRLTLNTKNNDPIYTIIPIVRKHTPFYLKKNILLLNNKEIGKIDLLENDDVVIGYFRKNKKVLTLNSNARSQCVGCSFCPNTLEKTSDIRFSILENLTNYFSVLAKTQGWKDISSLEIITICTGCFLQEDLAIDHLIMVKNAAKDNGFKGKIHILTSVIRSKSAMKKIKKEIVNFKLTLTIECFTNREIILKNSKTNMSFTEMKQILINSKSFGFDTNYTYIVGIDPLKEAIPKLSELNDAINTFPNFQIYQTHNHYMETFCDSEAKTIDYYLKARNEIEKIFIKTKINPQSWENYRSLWYYYYQNKKLTSIRI